MPERILITGGAGFIGTQIAGRLLDQGHEVVLYDSFVQYAYPMDRTCQRNIEIRFQRLEGKARLVRGSTQNLDYLIRTMQDVRPTRVIHLAAMPLAKLAIEHPEEAATSILQGTLCTLQATRHVDTVQRFVYISSSMVYGDFLTSPVPEDHPTNPKEIYGGLKLSGEILSRTFAQRYGLDVAIARPSAVYGPTDNNERVLAIFLRNALAGRPLRVFGESVPLDFTYVTDAADGMIAVALHPRASMQTFNITRSEAHTTLEAGKLVAELIPGTKIEVVAREEHLPARGALDITRAREYLGFTPKIALEEGLSLYLDFLRNRGDA